jgi:metallo-beta-lactamase class B
MIKALSARNPGFTGDADMAAGPRPAQKVLDCYGDARLVVPGHGPAGDLTLIRHTIKLCQEYNRQNP